MDAITDNTIIKADNTTVSETKTTTGAAVVETKADVEVKPTDNITPDSDITNTTNTDKLKGWRADLKVHPAAHLMPPMGEDELRELADDIDKNCGLSEPVAFYDDPVLGLCLLDGRNRLDALALLGREVISNGLPAYDFREVGVGDEAFDPYAFVISANIKRRHLKPDQRVDLIIKIIAMKPEKSDRQIAKEIGVDHKTIGRARTKGEDVGRLPHVDARTDTKGRKQPAKKKDRSKAATAKAAPAKVKEPITYDFKLLREAWREVESMAAAANRTRLLSAIDQLETEAITALKADSITLAPDRGLQ